MLTWHVPDVDGGLILFDHVEVGVKGVIVLHEFMENQHNGTSECMFW